MQVLVATSPPGPRRELHVKQPAISMSPALSDSFYKVYPTLQMQNKCCFCKMSKA